MVLAEIKERLDDPFKLCFGCFLSDLAGVSADNRPPSLPELIMRYLPNRDKFFQLVWRHYQRRYDLTEKMISPKGSSGAL
jgi:hypothetical protein